jgi:hypothetical protein
MVLLPLSAGIMMMDGSDFKDRISSPFLN